MDKNGFLALVLLAVIASTVSDASSVTKLRKMAGEAPQANSSTKISPVPSPVSVGNESNSNLTAAGKADNSTKSIEPSVGSNSSSKAEPKSSGYIGAPIEKEKVNGGKEKGGKEKGGKEKGGKEKGGKEKGGKEKGGIDGKVVSEAKIGENCDSSPNKCRDQNKMIACVQSSESGSRELPLLVLNEGESTLKVSLTQPASAKDALKDVDVLAHQTKMIVILVPVGESSKIVLNAGEGDCIILFGAPVSKVNYFLQLPSYSQLVTPINGAYLMIFTAVVLAATWACCIFRKRRRHAGVPYQELEMGFTESGSAANVETAEGWDQDWDDEWDEDAVKNMSGGHHIGSISANGLTSRSSNKDGWENDWDE